MSNDQDKALVEPVTKEEKVNLICKAGGAILDGCKVLIKYGANKLVEKTDAKEDKTDGDKV